MISVAFASPQPRAAARARKPVLSMTARSFARCSAVNGRMGSRVRPPGRPIRSSGGLDARREGAEPEEGGQHAGHLGLDPARLGQIALDHRPVELRRGPAEDGRARIHVADGAFRERREAEEARIAGEDADPVAGDADDRGQRAPILRALLDADHLVLVGEAIDQREAQIDPRATRDVVEQDRQRALGDHLAEVIGDLLLARHDVPGRRDHHDVAAGVRRLMRLLDDLVGEDGAAAGDHRHPARSRLDRLLEDDAALRLAEGPALAGAAVDEQAVDAVLDHHLGETEEPVGVERGVVVEGRGQRGDDAAEVGVLHRLVSLSGFRRRPACGSGRGKPWCAGSAVWRRARRRRPPRRRGPRP